MAKFTLSLSLLRVFVLVLSLNMGKITAQDVPLGLKTWCVAKPSATESKLLDNINFVCHGQGGVPCHELIQPRGVCFTPATPINHASVVMNVYFQYNGRSSSACSFEGSGLVVLTDPSFEGCPYAYRP